MSVKVSEAKPEDIHSIKSEITQFNMPHPKDYFFLKSDIVFVAKNNQKIVGFLVLLPEMNGSYELESLFLRLGHDRKGIGSKLVGKANSFLIQNKARMVHVAAGNGRYLEKGKIVKNRADGFYRRINYERDRASPNRFVWFPKPNKRIRNPKVRNQKVGLAPQNLLNPDGMLKRRARRR